MVWWLPKQRFNSLHHNSGLIFLSLIKKQMSLSHDLGVGHWRTTLAKFIFSGLFMWNLSKYCVSIHSEYSYCIGFHSEDPWKCSQQFIFKGRCHKESWCSLRGVMWSFRDRLGTVTGTAQAGLCFFRRITAGKWNSRCSRELSRRWAAASERWKQQANLPLIQI